MSRALALFNVIKPDKKRVENNFFWFCYTLGLDTAGRYNMASLQAMQQYNNGIVEFQFITDTNTPRVLSLKTPSVLALLSNSYCRQKQINPSYKYLLKQWSLTQSKPRQRSFQVASVGLGISIGFLKEESDFWYWFRIISFKDIQPLKSQES